MEKISKKPSAKTSTSFISAKSNSINAAPNTPLDTLKFREIRRKTLKNMEIEESEEEEEKMDLIESRLLAVNKQNTPEHFFYISSNWFLKHQAFQRKKTPKGDPLLLKLKQKLIKKILPSLKKMHSIITPNTFSKEPEFPILTFKAAMKSGLTDKDIMAGMNNLVSLMKDRGYTLWMFKGLKQGDYFLSVGISQKKMIEICLRRNIKRKLLGVNVEHSMNKLIEKLRFLDYESIGEFEIKGVKFEPFSTREKRKLVYYDLQREVDLTSLIKNTGIQEVRWMNDYSNLQKISRIKSHLL
jgi:hypothetical protein